MRFEPHEYQTYSIQRLVNEPRVGLFHEMGLGKSVITLTAILELISQGKACKALVIAPKRVAENTWPAEARKWDHLAGLRVCVVAGSPERRERALQSMADVYVIGRDNTAWLVGYLGRRWPFDCLVIDELSGFKDSSTMRFKALRRALPACSRVFGLTGTPAPNGVMDLWAQVFLLDWGERLGRTLSGFQARYFDYNPYRYEYKPKAGAFESVHRKIADICVSMRAEDYLSLPPLITRDIPVTLDSAASKLYRKLEREYVLELRGQAISAANAAVLASKLLQLCCGSVYGESIGCDTPVDANTREIVRLHECKRDALTEAFESLNGDHAIVMYQFRHSIPDIEHAARLAGLRVLRLGESGSVDAWNRGEADLLLAHPASGAYGLNLQEGGRHMIWYTLPWSLQLYQQAVARLHRQGQTRPVIVHRLLVPDSVEADVAALLNAKRAGQDALLDALRARVERAAA